MTESEVLASLLRVREAALEQEARLSSDLRAIPASHRLGGINLAHYLAVRQFDLREEQRALARLGLSSLGRAEAHILATLDAVVRRLSTEVDAVELPTDLGERGPQGHLGASLLKRNSEAAASPELAGQLVASGMDVARINCAHDSPEAWGAMARYVRSAAESLGRSIPIAFDLPGPKLRTGPLPPGPEVIRARPRRDAYGRVRQPARVVFAAEPAAGNAEHAPPDGAVVVPASASVLSGVRLGDRFVLTDARGRSREFDVVAIRPGSVETTCCRTSYLTSETPIKRLRETKVVASGELGSIPPAQPSIQLRAGQELELRYGTDLGHEQRETADGVAVEPATISVDLPEIFTAVELGHRVLLDDGKIEGVVREIAAGRIRIEITRPERARLRAEKGINLPDTDLALRAPTKDDRAILELVAPLADLVALSYVRDPDEVDELHAEFDRVDAAHARVILKIEHRAAFEALPALLLHALRRPPAAVMVARGDLAVEVGFERLAELQEEILWLSEAAHVPVIWATQVLESLAKDGAPTRAEVTDAAWSSRAECVMLNKGPHVVETIQFLDDILSRMHEHQDKRTPMLRRLAVASALDPATRN